MRLSCRALVFLAAGLAGNVLAASPPFEVVRAEFGLFDASDPKAIVFEPTLMVPHRQGQRYGWMIELRTARRSLSVREEYVLPKRETAAPAVAAENDAAQVVELLQERRSQVSQRQLVPVDGRIYGEWSIGPNEPAGHRRLQVVIEGQVVARFEFDVR